MFHKVLTISTPEVENWIVPLLAEAGIRFVSMEGYSVKKDQVTGLFERRACGTPAISWNPDDVREWITENEDIEEWQDRTILSEILGVPLFLVLWKENVDSFRMFRVRITSYPQLDIIHHKDFNSCSELAKFFSDLKGIPVTKAFEEKSRLSSIDNCLRRQGVPWPGNLDAFLVDKKGISIDGIFEFSRTRKTQVKYHDINQYYHKDVNRWAPPDILSRQLDCPLIIILWSSTESIVKIQKIREIKDGLHYESEDLIDSGEIVGYFEDYVRTP